MPDFMGILGGFGQKALNIQRECYTMASVDGKNAEIVMYGEIVNKRPKNWWTGELIEGKFIILSEFLDDLKALEKADDITLRINSVGGDAYASIAIHNRLRELKGKVTAIVDGVAMSGGSLIMCAANTVKVNPSSLIMIHNCLTMLYGQYNATELQKTIAHNNSVDKAQAAIYKRKTGMEEGDILALMASDTYMTGAEAMKKGFADELLEEEAPDIAASADGCALYVNGRAMVSQFPFFNLPDNIPTQAQIKMQNAECKNKGGTTSMTLEQLKKDHPDLYRQAMAEAQESISVQEAAISEAKAERERIKAIDDIAALYSSELVQAAKYGDNPCTAQELTYRAAQEAVKKGKDFLNDMEGDAKASGTATVNAVPGTNPVTSGGEMTPEERYAAGRADAVAMQEKGGN